MLLEGNGPRGSAKASARSFDPIVDDRTQVLILGTMPGALSLARQQYYAHERNRFWRVMENLLGIPPEATYEKRIAALRAAGIGLWDTLKHCERPGSLDVDIRNGEPNDLSDLLLQHASIRTIALNGKTASAIFRNQILSTLPPAVSDRLTVLELPSTSPANARGGLPRLWEEWKKLAECL